MFLNHAKTGLEITVSDGQNTKTTTVTDVKVTTVDFAKEIVSGTGTVGKPVTTWFNCNWGNCPVRYSLVGSNGQWSADFSKPGTDINHNDDRNTYDIKLGDNLDAWIQDEDGDKTDWYWDSTLPHMDVWPADNSIDAYDWAVGKTLTLKIDDPDTLNIPVDYTSTAVVDSYHHAHFDTGNFNILTDFLVTMTDGAIEKSMRVAQLNIQDINLPNATLSGTTLPQRHVWTCLWGNNSCLYRETNSDIDGNWSLNFGVWQNGNPPTDLRPGREGGVNVNDDDGDNTSYHWKAMGEGDIRVDLNQNWVDGGNWALNKPVDLTIKRKSGDPDYTASKTPDSTPYYQDAFSVVAFNPNFAVQPGDIITESNTRSGGTTTRTHTVLDLAVTNVNTANDQISGTTDPDAKVLVEVWDGNLQNFRYITADGSGNWTADFSKPGSAPDENNTYNIQPGDTGEARRTDDQGNWTRWDWLASNPHLTAYPNNSQNYQLQAADWSYGTPLNLTIYRKGNSTSTPDWTDSMSMGWQTSFFDFTKNSGFNLQSGDDITVEGGGITHHMVVDAISTSINTTTDVVSGTTTKNANLSVDVNNSNPYAVRHVKASPVDGKWSANFKTAVGDESIRDIKPGDSGSIYIDDGNGDQTVSYWSVANPVIQVMMPYNCAYGYEWPYGAKLTLKVDDPASGSGWDFITPVIQAVTVSSYSTWICAPTGTYTTLKPGVKVELTDGTTVRDHTIPFIDILNVDQTGAKVYGIAEPGTDVHGGIWPENSEDIIPDGTNRDVTADSNGLWVMDFKNPGNNSGEYGTVESLKYYGWATHANDTQGNNSMKVWYTNLAAPLNLNASDGTFTDKVAVSWDALSVPPSKYQLYRSTSITGLKMLLPSILPGTTSYNDTLSTAGIRYYYWIQACSTSTSCGYYGMPAAGYRSLAVPTAGLSATSGSNTANVTVSWTAVSGANSYEVYRANANDPTGTNKALIGSPTGVSYADTNAETGLTYYYWVKSCYNGNCSAAYSSAVSGWRGLNTTAGVAATDGTDLTQVTVTWSAVAGATSYQVARSTSLIGTRTPLNGSVSGLSYHDTGAVAGITAGITYNYWVTACLDSHCSTGAGTDSGWRGIPAPGGLMATDGSMTDKVTLTWNAVSGASSYRFTAQLLKAGLKPRWQVRPRPQPTTPAARLERFTITL